MLIDLLLSGIYGFINFALGGVNLPTFPDEFMGYVDTAVEYLQTGLTILGNYVDLNYVKLLVEMFIALWLAFELYKFIMWILRKIPILNIK